MTAFGTLGLRLLLGAAAAAVVAVVLHLLLGWVWSQPPAILALVLGLIGATLVVVQHRTFGSPAALARVAASGRPASALVTGAHPTSSRIGANPVMRLDLRIDGYERHHTVLVPINQVHLVRPGVVLPVRVDPADPKPLIVEWDRLP